SNNVLISSINTKASCRSMIRWLHYPAQKENNVNLLYLSLSLSLLLEMSQCVPSWDLDDSAAPPKLTLRAYSNSNSLAPDVPMLDYEVAELTWENGQIAMHGLGPPRLPNKPPPVATAASPTAKYTWEKPSAGGTLESIVDQATGLPYQKTTAREGDSDELVPWFDNHRAVAASASATMTMDALVPCSARTQENNSQILEEIGGTCVMGCSTRVGSNTFEKSSLKRARVARVPEPAEWSSRDNSVSGSATFDRDSLQLTLDTCERELGVCGFTSTSLGSPENTSSAKQRSKATADDHDSPFVTVDLREIQETRKTKRNRWENL
ncbi:hypothetical protein NMG60_11023081, partial [Bertholletia excelsa]